MSSSSKIISEVGSIPVETYYRPSNAGLKNITVTDIKMNYSKPKESCHSEIALVYGKNSDHLQCRVGMVSGGPVDTVFPYVYPYEELYETGKNGRLATEFRMCEGNDTFFPLRQDI